MINKTKEVLKKLEFGVLEFFVGALMVIGLVGYFGNVPADLDWIDHTVSFVLFSYLFYKLDITSILFGKTSKFANLVIIVSYFSLFFKDIISYTKLDAFKFKVITFVNYFYNLFNNNLAITNFVTFYIGVFGILMISIYLTKKIEISHPSFLYAICQKKIKSNLIKFSSIFILLLGFYYFVYNTILEWLEFVIDDPVIAAGVIFYIYTLSKHHKKFHTSNFVFKIGDFSTKWYRRFVSLFHCKKTLPLAISGLLILHALADLGVFAYSMTFLKKNFYLEHLGKGHQPFLKLFLEDAGNIPSYAAMPLFLDYLLNDLSLIIFLVIPIIVWARMFSHKELHFNRVFLFFIYSSAAAYALLPGYIIKPLSGGSIAGVDISSISLLKNKSVLDNFFPNKSAIIVAVSLISIAFGLIIYILSSSSKIKRELYAISIIGGLTFYTVYLYYFFSSLALYLYSSIALVAFTPHFLIGIILAIFLALSIMFYIGGYLMFLYEIVMEYHKRKWSDSIDEELVAAIQKIKNIEKKMIKPKKSQIIGEVFKYALIGVFSVIVLIAGYKMVGVVKEKACNTEIAKLEIDMRNIDKSLRFGTKELQSYDVPCKVDQIYFFDLNKNIEPENFKEIPLIKDTLKSRGNNNVFLVKEGEVKRSFYAGNLEMAYPYYICFKPKFDKISLFIEGAGKTAKIASSCEQPECTYIPLDISEEDARRIIKESIDFGCAFCPKDFDKELDNLRLTRQNVEMFRKLTVCEGITNVEILIRPKKGAIAKNFRFYEFIPKTCIDDLSKYLAENVEGNVEIKGDPLLMWYFDDLGKEQKLSYKLSAELSDECMQAIQGLGVAQFVEGKKEEKEIAGANTAPTIQGLPDVTVSGLGLNRNVIANVWKYAQDKETNTRNLVYTIIDQTNPNIVDCMINNEKHVDCELKQNKEGASRVTIQVDDLEFTDRASFNVRVSQSCKKHERKKCVGNQVYWFDTCNNQEELDKICGSDEICELEDCEKRASSSEECNKNNDCRFYETCKNGKCCILGPINPFCP